MGTLYLVRHGQASFGADDYDVLSRLGRRQSVRLGEYFRNKGVRFDAALTGTLNRQVQTFAGICEGHVLGTSREAMIELNLGIRNCSVTEFSFSPRRHRLQTFNTLPHLDAPEYASWVTYA